MLLRVLPKRGRMIVLLTLSTAVGLSATSYVCLRRDVRRKHPEIFRVPAAMTPRRLHILSPTHPR